MWQSSQIGIEGGSLVGNTMEGSYGADAVNINGGTFSLIRETVSGCAEPEACNYNSDANVDDGSCTYPTETYLNCEGLCLADTDGDGICDENDDLSIDEEQIPTDYSLTSIYPNPFNPATTISFSISKFGLTTVTAYDITGRKLETLTNEILGAGNYSFSWNASPYPSGVYLIRIDSGDFTQTQKVVLVK